MERILVFSPHPDDDIIGCVGSIAKHIQQGDQVSIIYMTSGEAGSLESKPEELIQIREEEASADSVRLRLFVLTKFQ